MNEIFKELGQYMKLIGVEKDVATGVVLICKSDEQMKSILKWLKSQPKDKAINSSDIFEKCLEIEKTIP